jgi:hypothetical protein
MGRRECRAFTRGVVDGDVRREQPTEVDGDDEQEQQDRDQQGELDHRLAQARRALSEAGSS